MKVEDVVSDYAANLNKHYSSFAYAFLHFTWLWLLLLIAISLFLSKPPGCFSILTSFSTERPFRGLSWWSGLFPSWVLSLSPKLSLVYGKQCLVFGVCNDLVPFSQPVSKQCSTPRQLYRYRCASTHFGENQLALNSIGISPLTTTHPPIFQHRSVRQS